MAKAVLGSLRVGDGESVAVMGVINLSRDSFFRGSVTDPSEVVNRAARMVSDGAGMIDLGAMATGPSSKPVAPEAEKRALIPAVRAVVRALDAPVSVDTQRAEVAAEAVSAGASVVNDVTGLKGDPEMV
ncbi:MAG: dihydropteroate synthase, partial [Candidatus Hadarchaeales archaeon]